MGADIVIQINGCVNAEESTNLDSDKRVAPRSAKVTRWCLGYVIHINLLDN